MDQFVCVRMVKANALDLTLFQFDFDLTFAAFMLNSDKTIYGRYGTRSDHKEAQRDISLEGFRKALAGALKLHKNYPLNKSSLNGKLPSAVTYKSPEEYPSLKGKYQPNLNYSGNVVRSCMHCHQIRDAQRRVYRDAGKPIPDHVLYPWPMPDVIGLSLDSKEMAKIKTVSDDSPAERAGFRRGDKILKLQGQPILSIADIQWVLHKTPSPAKLQVEVEGNGRSIKLSLSLPEKWRTAGDISWRPTSWDLRRMATGGLLLKSLSSEEQKKTKLPGNAIGLRVEHVGQYNEHAVAKRAGFKKGDIFVAFGGRQEPMTESEFFAFALQNQKPGDQIPATVFRDGRLVELVLRMQ